MSVENWRKQLEKFTSTLPADLRDNRRLALSAFLSRKKERILSSPHFSGSPSQRARGRREFARIRSKILAKAYGKGKQRFVAQSPKLLLYRNSPDHLRDTLCPKFMSRWIPIEKRIGRKAGAEITLSNFSFARNPKGTLLQIRNIARLAAHRMGVRINFTDSKCDDVAPYVVLAQVMKSLPPVFSGGMINREVASVLESVGLDKMLGVRRLVRDTSPFPIFPFQMVFRAPPGFFGDQEHLLRPQYKEYIADRFCSALDSWLEAKGFELTPNGAQALVVSITEALDNAERHGCPEIDDGLGDWSMGGFARIIHDGSEIHRIECSVAIVSIGSTISSSLQTAGPKVSDLVDGYVSLQKRRFGTDINLARTIAAVQDGITRIEAASQANRGGIGLLTLAEIFADLGDTDQAELQSVFTILSGNSCLRLTTPYRKGLPPPGTTLRKLWFNAANDGNMEPDANHAFKIDEMFAGTILSACFCIDPAYLQRKLAA